VRGDIAEKAARLFDDPAPSPEKKQRSGSHTGVSLEGKDSKGKKSADDSGRGRRLASGPIRLEPLSEKKRVTRSSSGGNLGLRINQANSGECEPRKQLEPHAGWTVFEADFFGEVSSVESASHPQFLKLFAVGCQKKKGR
jgi:hypothetical protein